MSRNRPILIIIILLGLALRLFILSQRGSFWFDEAFSVHFATMDLRTMLGFLKFENNPPGYFILLHFWIKLLGSSELAVRSLSMVFGLASIPLIYLLGARLHSKTAGLFAAFLLAISSFQVFYATETRMYSLYLFLTLLVVLFFIRLANIGIDKDIIFVRSYKNDAMESSPTFYIFNFTCLPVGMAFLILLSLLVWTHITAWMIIAGLLFYLFWQSQFQFKQFIIHNSKFLILGALLALQFLPWIINFIKIKFTAPLAQGYFFHIPPDKNYFIEILETFIMFSQDNAFIVTIASALMGMLLWFAFERRSNLRIYEDWISPNIKFLLCWLFVPLFIGFAFQNAVPRYFIAVAPALYLLLGVGYARLIQQFKKRFGQQRQCYVLCVMCYVLLFTLVMPDYPSLAQAGHHDWDKLAGWIEERESGSMNYESGTLILVNPHSEVLPFERYYHGNLPVVGFYPVEDNDDRDTRIVKTNWISLNTKENIRALADITKNYNQVFLITGGVEPIGRNIVPIWFWENGWQRQAVQELGKISVILLVRVL